MRVYALFATNSSKRKTKHNCMLERYKFIHSRDTTVWEVKQKFALLKIELEQVHNAVAVARKISMGVCHHCECLGAKVPKGLVGTTMVLLASSQANASRPNEKTTNRINQ